MHPTTQQPNNQNTDPAKSGVMQTKTKREMKMNMERKKLERYGEIHHHGFLHAFFEGWLRREYAMGLMA